MAVSPTRAAALGDIAKVRGMGDIARASGLTREALALQGFAPRRSATLRDLARVCHALGLKLRVRAA